MPARGFERFQALVLLGAALLIGPQVSAQPQTPPQIQNIKMPLIAWAASRPHAFPGSFADFRRDDARMPAFRDMVTALAAQDWPRAAELAKTSSYELGAIIEGGTLYIVASDDSKTGTGPAIVINTKPRRDFIAQAPHVPFEPGTGEQAVIFLKSLGGRAVLIAGAHRCASGAFSACDGKTEVCGGGSQSYRDSDAGHNVNTLFHAAHLVLAERWPKSIVMSLHGMLEDTDGVKTSVIVSNGARGDDEKSQTVATKFRLALEKPLASPGVVVSCNHPPDKAYKARPLCGTTNVQGRHVNGDADVCKGSVDQGTGRFIHMEQDWAVLGPYAQSWGDIGSHKFNTAFVRSLAGVLPAISKQ